MAIEPPQDVDADWRVVARALANELLDFADYHKVMASLDSSVKQWLALEQAEDTGVVGPDSLAFPYYMAASVLREADGANPAARAEWETNAALMKTLRQLRDDADAEHPADPSKAVLISARLRGSSICRIVHTKAGKVRREFMYKGGWLRGAGDLRPVVEADALEPAIRRALCPTPGDLDELPAEESLAFMKRLDPSVIVSRPKNPPVAPEVDLPLAVFMLGSRPTDAAIASVILSIAPAAWHTVFFRVSPVRDVSSLWFRYHMGQSEERAYEFTPIGRLRSLLARRFEMTEGRQGRTWRTLSMKVSRLASAEWQS